MKGSVVVGLLVVFTALAGLATPVGAAYSSPDATSALSPEEVTASDFDSTTFEIHVHEDGSATWTFRYEIELDQEDGWSNAEFDQFAAAFELEETPLYDQFVTQAELLTQTGQERTDREMTASSFERTTDVDGQLNEHGIVELSFHWEGFAGTDGDRLVVDDVFSEPSLNENQAVVLTADEGLQFESAEPAPTNLTDSIESADRLQWGNDHELSPGEPHVVLVSSESGDTLLSNTLAGNTGGVTLWLIGFILVATVISVTAWLAWQARKPQPPLKSEDRQRGTRPSEEPTAEEPDEGVPEVELLSDEDQIIALLEQNDGRMKQVNIVEETGWSKSKVSMVLSEMDDEGTISKLRVGRENIVSLSGHEPDATKSPFDD